MGTDTNAPLTAEQWAASAMLESWLIIDNQQRRSIITNVIQQAMDAAAAQSLQRVKVLEEALSNVIKHDVSIAGKKPFAYGCVHPKMGKNPNVGARWATPSEIAIEALAASQRRWADYIGSCSHCGVAEGTLHKPDCAELAENVRTGTLPGDQHTGPESRKRVRGG